MRNVKGSLLSASLAAVFAAAIRAGGRATRRRQLRLPHTTWRP